ncbi:MAG: rhodanese-like domain-containing protein [Deltaproteobacteria bacterium]|nr:rhodanese-like domain-containing protein [Deltaproteobacteria bacterium]
MNELSPREAFDSPQLVLVDVRPTLERYGELGFIPGSLSLPWSDDLDPYTDDLAAIARGQQAALVCATGTRARHYARQLAELGELQPLVLQGGVLGWDGVGLPVCGRGRDLPDEPVLVPEQFPRQLAACFVGELAEVALERDVDPLRLLRDCFERAGQSYEAPIPAELHRVLDQLAASSRRLGTPLPRIAANLDRMLAVLPLPAA